MFIVVAVVCGSNASAPAQTGNGQRCPLVTARNPEEAVMMEAAAGKVGCWVRESGTGQLVFVGPTAPIQNHPPYFKTPPGTSGASEVATT